MYKIEDNIYAKDTGVYGMSLYAKKDFKKDELVFVAYGPDTEKVKSKMGTSFALFSDNDPWVPVENAEDFKERLGSEVLIQHNQSHFNEGAGFTELPIALEKLLEMAES